MLMVVRLALGVLLPVSAIVALLVYRRLELEAKATAFAFGLPKAVKDNERVDRKDAGDAPPPDGSAACPAAPGEERHDGPDTASVVAKTLEVRCPDAAQGNAEKEQAAAVVSARSIVLLEMDLVQLHDDLARAVDGLAAICAWADEVHKALNSDRSMVVDYAGRTMSATIAESFRPA